MPKKTIEELLDAYETYAIGHYGYPIPESADAKKKARDKIIKRFKKQEAWILEHGQQS